jgi:hypothetical protein
MTIFTGFKFQSRSARAIAEIVIAFAPINPLFARPRRQAPISPAPRLARLHYIDKPGPRSYLTPNVRGGAERAVYTAFSAFLVFSGED